VSNVLPDATLCYESSRLLERIKASASLEHLVILHNLVRARYAATERRVFLDAIDLRNAELLLEYDSRGGWFLSDESCSEVFCE